MASHALTMAAAELSAVADYPPDVLARFNAAVADLAQAAADQRRVIARALEGAL